MIYEKYSGNSVSVKIENTDEKDPYTKIGAKAFLSCKSVYEIKLPHTVCEIGDWAFAHMKELKKIIVPAKEISIGKDAFLDCDSLLEISFYPDATDNPGISRLLATCITILKSYELLDFYMAAKQNKKWCELYDRELLKYISQTDNAGFQPVIVGWFNDEGEEEQLKRYIERIKTNKINLCFMRLKYDTHISDYTKEALLSYLKEQLMRLENGDDSSWMIIREVLKTDFQYVKLSITNELFSDELMSELITYFNESGTSAEMVAYLMQTLNGKNSSSIDEQFEL